MHGLNLPAHSYGKERNLFMGQLNDSFIFKLPPPLFIDIERLQNEMPILCQ